MQQGGFVLAPIFVKFLAIKNSFAFHFGIID